MSECFFSGIDVATYPEVSLHVISQRETIVDLHKTGIRKAIETCDIPHLLNISLDSPIVKIEPGTVAHGFVRSNSEEIILFHTPAQTRTIHLEQPQARSFDFHYKDMLFVIKRNLQSRSFSHSLRMFTFDRPNDTLYVPPLYNLSRDGSMCFGSVKTGDCETIQNFLDISVFGSIWTHVSFVPPKIARKGSLSAYLYSHRRKGWSFSDLVPWGSFKTLLKEVNHA